MATTTRQKQTDEQLALLMKAVTEGQQQQQLLAQEQRAWREEFAKEQRSQRDRQEQQEVRLLEWQEKFSQMQLQQHQRLVAEQRELLETQATEQLSRYQQVVQRLEQLEQKQGEREQHLVQDQKGLREHLYDLQERVDLAKSDCEQRFADLREEVDLLRNTTKRDVSSMREELHCAQQELGHAQEQLRAEVTELGRRFSVKESTLRVAAPEFSPAGVVPSTSGCGSDGELPRTLQRPPQYDGRSPWDAYRTQFEMLATVNRWTGQEKATYLAVSLKGIAVNVLNGIPPDKLYDYDALTVALEARFGNGHQAELHRMKLKNRVRKREESLTELAEDVEKLLRLAYPGADAMMLELLGVDHFIDALHDEEMRLKVRQSRPKTLREAVKAALELESFQLASRQRLRPVRGAKVEIPVDSEANTMAEFQKQLLEMVQQALVPGTASRRRWQGRWPQSSGQQRRKTLTCWSCDQPGHRRRDCPREKERESKDMPGVAPTQQEQGNEK